MRTNEMQCKDFREIADSYLSDELLVETNHDVFRHLENCEDCRRELGGRREVRSKLRGAVRNAPESQIDANFVANLRQNLEKEAFHGNGFADILQTIFQPKIFALSAAALLVAFLISFTFWGNSEGENYNNSYQTAWTNVAVKALGDHEHCALDKYDYWKQNDTTETAEEKVFGEKVIGKIQNETVQTVKLVSIHDCESEGKIFHHAIVNVGDHIVSITQTASEIAPDEKQSANFSEVFAMRRENFELAGFTDGGKAFYVISDLPQTENRRIAEIFSGSLQARNRTAFKFASANYAVYMSSADF